MRELIAIVRKTFGSKKAEKRKSSKILIAFYVGFVLAMFAFSYSMLLSILGREKKVELSPNLIVLNPSQRWCDYLRFNIDVEGISPDNELVLDYSTDEKVKGSPFEGRDFQGKIYFSSSKAYYDSVSFSSWMKEKDAGILIVFPEDFDYKIEHWETESLPEILVYYPSNHIEYREYTNVFSFYFLEDGFLKTVQTSLGIPLADGDLIETNTVSVGTEFDKRAEARNAMGRHMVPFFFFIAILYTSMIFGMEAIAGEKERGTFAAILMTPIPRMTIVLGNYIGVFLHTLIASGFLFVLVLMSHFGCGILDYLAVALLVISLALFVSAITLIVSVLNSSIAQAQTTFLPVFLIFLVVCVNCMQGGNIDESQFYLPIYGHFYGIGNSLLGETSFLQVFVAMLYSIGASAICIFLSERLLHSEQFTVAIESRSDREIRRLRKRAEKQQKDYVSIPRSNLYDFKPVKRKSLFNFITHHAFLPLIMLAIFQPLGMLPSIASYLKDPESNGFMAMIKAARDAKSVSEVTDVVATSMAIFNMFMRNRSFIVFMALSYVIIILIYMIMVKFFDRNKIKTMGFAPLKKSVIIKKYLSGMGFGFVLIGSVYLLLIITGQVKVTGFALNMNTLPLFLTYILMWIPQGAAEEVMFRGYMLPRVASRFGIVFAVFFSSVCFSLMHGSNAGFTFLAFFNLILIASLFAYIAYKSGHIYTVCAMHTVWNFCQGNVFGLEVSGSESTASVLSSSYSSGAMDLLTGGAFGPEGGFAVTVVIGLAFITAYYLFEIRNHKA